MSALDLLRQLDAEATDGPWTAHGDDHVGWLSGPPTGYDGEYETPPDARLIATLRTLLPEIRAVLEAAQGLESAVGGPGVTPEDDEARASGELWDANDALDAKAAAL